MKTKIRIIQFWFYGLLLSFSYELPIINITSFDRLNPRLYDFFSFFGLFIVLPLIWQIKSHNPIYRAWKYIVIWFSLCAISGLFLYSFPSQIELFSIFFAFKYFQDLLNLWLIVKILRTSWVTLRGTILCLITGGIFVAIYSLFEYNSGNYGEIEYMPGKFIMKPEGYIWGPFGNSYFQIANYIPLVFIITFTYSLIQVKIKKLFFIVLSLFLAWPILFCGSRTALALFFITILVFFTLYFIKLNRYFIKIIPVFILLLTGTYYLFSTVSSEKLTTLKRMENLETDESANDIEDRIALFQNFNLDHYEKEGLFVPLVGGGFYVAPKDGIYRIGYGFHNIYLFALEQAGLIGLILFLIFIAITLKKLLTFQKGQQLLTYEKLFILAISSYFIGQLIIGISGHTFWSGFGTNNFNSLRLIVLVVATTIEVTQINEKQGRAYNYSSKLK